ncbi:ankyrin repeat-containing domain protein [Lasiosphaeria ovina]|uniref:Ankyrin repeat-containing domain protein n=1 Tax=Lasiosphaeria ovina TaxID=92902 RepID=A0AAE0JUV2_9PEZI|nr:ankyrin repeat-containing domain protein [Lasiosphaeria ovina]
MAVSYGQLEIVRLLLNSGADAGRCDRHGHTPLDIAVVKGYEPIISLPLDRGRGDAESTDAVNLTPLMLAAANDHTAITSMLLENGASAASMCENTKTSLHLAASHSGGDKTIDILLHYEAQVNSQDQYHKTPLWYASGIGNVSAVQSLIKYGADVKQPRPLFPSRSEQSSRCHQDSTRKWRRH